jgi:large subunit ribosomal protein L3
MSHKLMGRKIGMTQHFDEHGHVVACTVVQAEPNIVSQIKRKESDGYDAIQIAFGVVDKENEKVLQRRLSKPRVGHFKKAGIKPHRHLTEVRVEDPEAFTVGQELKVDLFEAGNLVDVCGTTIGRGFQGVMRLHGFKGGPAAHGSGFHRLAGSTGMRSTPGRCLEGGKRASQMGNRRRTTQNLKIVSVDPERNVILIKGSIPGHKGALVTIGSAVKKGQ